MNRRNFIQFGTAAAAMPKGGVTSTVGIGKAASAQTVTPAPRLANRNGKPNILMIMADQLRMDCVGAYGNKSISTPHIDRLAKEGILFQNAYTSVPSCTPARTALMTGLGPWCHGMLGMVPMATNKYSVEKASALAAAGYYAVSIGKNHYNPITNAHGYRHMITDEHCSYWFHKTDQRSPQSPEMRCDYESWFWSQLPDKDPHATGLGWNDQPAKAFVYPEELHATHWTGETAVRFLEQYDREEPLFLKVSFIRPHSPYDPPERFFRMYEHALLPEARVGGWATRYEPRSSERDDLWHGKLSNEEIHRSRAGYYGNVSFVDEQVGHLLGVLKRREMLDSTLIVFFSDHGDMLGDQNMWRKTYAYEPSAHIPMLMRPAASMNLGPAGRVVTNPVELRDMLPTFLDAAGAEIPAHIQGKSLLHLIRNGDEGWREYIDLEHNICYDVTNHWNGLTDGKWKYIFHAYSGEEQLFHLPNDPYELRDLSDDFNHRSDLELWRGRLVAHLSERGDKWVKDNKLQLRKEGTMLGPNFPGYSKTESDTQY